MMLRCVSIIILYPSFVTYISTFYKNITKIIIIRLINIVSRGSTNVNLEINTYRPQGGRKSEVLMINLRGPTRYIAIV